MITPYEDSQVPAIEKICVALESVGRSLAVMATGLGKTIVSAFVIKDSIACGRALLLCHDNSILEQDMAEYRLVLGDAVRMGVFHGEKKHWDEVDILFASLQTMRSWKDAFFENEFYRVIVDESHHSQAHTFKKVITYFKPKELLGLTGTPDRMDQKDIREIFGAETVNLSLEEGIGRGWLAQVEYHLITDNLNHIALKKLASDVLDKGKKISLKQLNETVFIRARDEKVAETILSYGRKKMIVFCEGVTHANHFQQFLPGSRVYHTGVTSSVNRQTLEDFRAGRCQRILVINKLNEGVNIPDAELIVFLRCTDSKNIFLQQLGRGLRKTPQKGRVIVLDFVANAHRVMMIREIGEKVGSFALSIADLEKNPLHINGDSFDFIFTDEQIDLFEVLQRLQPRYISDIPELVAEYSERNPIPASQVNVWTRQLLWWKCVQCGGEHLKTGHKRMSAHQRGRTHGYCDRDRGKCLKEAYPNLAAEYAEENQTPVEEVSVGSTKHFWWKCSKCNYKWQARPRERTRRNYTGCPACARQVATVTYNLLVLFPEIAKEYSDENDTPVTDIAPYSGLKYWWRCSWCGHRWRASCGNRTRHGTGCPQCRGQHPLPKAAPTATPKVRVRGNLRSNPKLASQYSLRNQEPLSKVSLGSHKKYWWKCPECAHEWESPPRYRVRQGGRCPNCGK